MRGSKLAIYDFIVSINKEVQTDVIIREIGRSLATVQKHLDSLVMEGKIKSRTIPSKKPGVGLIRKYSV